MQHNLTVNGAQYQVDIRADERLLEVLRDQLGLTGTKKSCGRGECGSCTVLVDGRSVTSCITLAARARQVETIEGVAQSPEGQELRQTFADTGAFQCGFCTPGQIVRAAALLRAGLPGDEASVRREMSGNICRCTGYAAIIEAVRRAAGRIALRAEDS